MGDGGCVSCHSGALFNDFQYHNLSTLVYNDDGTPVDPGRAGITGDEADLGKFQTPMLRSANQGSPFFHDGSIPGLKDTVRHHTSSVSRQDPNHDPVLDNIADLTEDELDDIVAFLKALRGQPLSMEYLTIFPELPYDQTRRNP